ncbi:MAG: hypothetical protein ACO3JG_13900, partial [Luteolibacter sp.]
MPAWRQNHAIRRPVQPEKLLKEIRGRHIRLQSHQAELSNCHPLRVSAASNSGTANTKRIRERQSSLRACSTKGRSRSLRYRSDFAAPFIVLLFVSVVRQLFTCGHL